MCAALHAKPCLVVAVRRIHTHIIIVFFGYTNLPIWILSHFINGIFLISSTFKPMKLYLARQRVLLVIRTILSFS